MNRRKFLQFLGLTPAALVVAPTALKAGGESLKQFSDRWRSNSQAAHLGEYHTYYSVSDPEIAKAIEEFEERQCQDGSIKQSKGSEDYSASVTTSNFHYHFGTKLRQDLSAELSRRAGLLA